MEWNAGSLIGTSSAYWRGCTLQAGVRLGIFTVLGAKSLSAEQVAAGIAADLRATRFLLDALAGMALIVKTGESYVNSEAAADLLDESAPGYLGHIIMHHHHLIDGWAQLDEAVRTGEPVVRRSYGDETERRSFLLGMYNLASGVAPKIVDAVGLGGRKRLLDLGGGPGTYAIHFCRHNPGLRAVVFDRKITEPFMRQIVASHGLQDRIDFIAGDFNRDLRSAGSYDVVWMSHVLHSNNFEQCVAIIEKISELLEPGGLLIIHDFILDDTKDKPEFATLFALNMLLLTAAGRTYSRGEIAGMLDQAGFSEVADIDPGAPNKSLVMTAIRRGGDAAQI